MTMSEIKNAAKTNRHTPAKVIRAIRTSSDNWSAYHESRPEILREYVIAEDPTREGGWVVRPIN